MTDQETNETASTEDTELTDEDNYVHARLLISGQLLSIGYGPYLTLAAQTAGVEGVGRIVDDSTALAYIHIRQAALESFVELLTYKHRSKEVLTLTVDDITVAVEPEVEYYRQLDGSIDSGNVPAYEDFGRFEIRYDDTPDDHTAQADRYQRDLDRLLMISLNMNLRGIHALIKHLIGSTEEGLSNVEKETERVRMGLKEVSGSVQKMAGELRRMRGHAKRKRRAPFDPAVH